MTSKNQIKIPLKVNTMSNRFAQVKATKKYKFCGVEIEIRKLSVADVIKVQEEAKKAEENKDDKANLDLLLTVIKLGVPEMADMPDSEIFDLPMEELSSLSTEITKYSGLGK